MGLFISTDPPTQISAPAAPIAVGPPSGSDGRGRLALLVSGAGAMFLAILLLAGGSAALWGLSQRDHAGFFTTRSHTISTSTYAMASESLTVGPDMPAWVGDNLGTVRIQASSEQPVFVGIGPSADVQDYLAGIQHDTITNFDTDPFTFDSRYRDGTARPSVPTSQGFWQAWSSGPGIQTVRWPVEKGNWSVVVMNADASAHVVAHTQLGASVPGLRWVAGGLLGVGAVILLAGLVLLYLGTGSTPSRSRV
jgi:hypothetical protein